MTPYFWVVCNIFRWCCVIMTEQVPMTPFPLISPIQSYLKVITCAVGDKYLFLSSWWSNLRQDELLPFEVKHIWKEAQLDLSDRLGTDHHVPVAMFLITPLFFTSKFRHLQPICVAFVIKTSWPVTETWFLGYRHTALVKGHAGFESPFVEIDRDPNQTSSFCSWKQTKQLCEHNCTLICQCWESCCLTCH